MVRDLEQYKDWVYIVSGPALLKVQPRFKIPILQELEVNKYLSTLPTTHRCLIHGSQVISMHELYVCLVGASCQAVRVQAYGMKTEVMVTCLGWGTQNIPLLLPTSLMWVGTLTNLTSPW